MSARVSAAKPSDAGLAQRPAVASARPAGRRRTGRLASGATIREAAATLFLERGYQGTSMDDIAAAARVSKQTIYTHFADKESLLSGLVLANADRVEAFLVTMASVVQDADDVEIALQKLARLYLHFVVRPEVLKMRRLVLAEAGRFPELARTYYEQVPQRVYATLATLFRELADQGALQVEDADSAAQHFAWLVLGPHLDLGMFCDASAAVASASDTAADDAVRVFLAAYRRVQQ
ncbi:MAG: TetR/AcrR family transcriptional regulator [Candidatus Dormiibacterota bacterium]